MKIIPILVFFLLTISCGKSHSSSVDIPQTQSYPDLQIPQDDTYDSNQPSEEEPIPLPQPKENKYILKAQYLPSEVFRKPSLPSNYHKEIEMNLDPETTAVMFIDIADVDNSIGYWRVLPLLEIARKYNFKIIHAIHEFSIPAQMQPLPGEIVINRYVSRCLSYITQHGIKYLLVAGSGTNTCVLDRPCGLLNLKNQYYYNFDMSNDLQIIFIRDATISAEMPGTWRDNLNKKMTLNLIEDHVGYTTTVKNVFEAFNEDFQEEKIDYRNYGYEDEENRPLLKELPPEKTMLIIANAYEKYSNKDLSNRITQNIAQYLHPLVELARKMGMQITHVFDNGLPSSYIIDILPDENTVNNFDQLANLLAQNPSITNILFAGYTTNRELLFGGAGLFNFRFRPEFSHKYKRFLVRDATVGFEFPDSMPNENGKYNAIHWFEMNGIPQINGEHGHSYSITLNDLYRIYSILPELARVKKENEGDDLSTFYCNHATIMLDIFNPYEISLNLGQNVVTIDCDNKTTIFQIPEFENLWHPKELRRVSLVRRELLLKSSWDLFNLRTTEARQREYDRGFPSQTY